MKKIIFALFFVPFMAAAQFEKVADEVCDNNTKAFIIFGKSDLNQTILKQPELKKLWVYELTYDSEFGKRLKVNSPTMYLFDKNMMALAREDDFDINGPGWDRMKEAIRRPTSKDCLLLANNVEKAADGDLVARPTEDELGEFKIELPDVEPWTPEPIPAEPEPSAKAASLSKTTTKAQDYPLEDLPAGLKVQKFWTVQIGAYASEANAKKKVAEYPDLYPTYKLVDGLYKVTFGTFTQEASAKEFAAKYKGVVKEMTW